jgi:hypothetical protein
MSLIRAVLSLKDVKPLNLFVRFLPLIVFGVVSRRQPEDGVAWAAAVATVTAATMLWMEQPRRPLRTLLLLQFGLLTAVAVAGVSADAGFDRWLSDWGYGLVFLTTGALLLTSVPTRPFTEPYARLCTRRAFWSSPIFTSMNRILSLAWAATIAAIGAAGVLTTAIAGPSASMPRFSPAPVLLNWVAPIFLLWAVARFDADYPMRVMESTAG